MYVKYNIILYTHITYCASYDYLYVGIYHPSMLSFLRVPSVSLQGAGTLQD